MAEREEDANSFIVYKSLLVFSGTQGLREINYQVPK